MSKNILALRKRIESLQAERAELQAQTRSRAEVSTLLDGMVTAWARAGQAALSREVHNAATGQPSQPLTLRDQNLGPLMVALLGAENVALALQGALLSVPEGLPSAARLARIAEIGTILDKLETEEESLIDGSGFERRPDARPEIVLG